MLWRVSRAVVLRVACHGDCRMIGDHGRGRDESLRARNFIQLSAYLSDTVRPALNDIRDRLAETLAALNAHRAEPLPGAEILSASSSSSPAFTINHEGTRKERRVQRRTFGSLTALVYWQSLFYNV